MTLEIKDWSGELLLEGLSVWGNDSPIQAMVAHWAGDAWRRRLRSWWLWFFGHWTTVAITTWLYAIKAYTWRWATWGCRRKCRLRWIPKDMEQRRIVGGCVGPLENNTRKKLLTLCSYILYVLSQHMRPQRVSHLAFTWWLLKLGDHTPIPKDLRKFDYVRIFHGLIGL